jgi:antitoxin (DNA-binding transcriptional repressor) of toxin-antitoxin stability system
MSVVSVTDAENQFSELVHRVEGGETVTVTRKGAPSGAARPHSTNPLAQCRG